MLNQIQRTIFFYISYCFLVLGCIFPESNLLISSCRFKKIFASARKNPWEMHVHDWGTLQKKQLWAMTFGYNAQNYWEPKDTTKITAIFSDIPCPVPIL